MPDQTKGCVLFADVSGSTKLYETVGDTKAHEAIARCVLLFSAITLEHGGRVVKTIGDEVMSVFPEPSQAAAAAKAIQSGVDSLAPVDRVRLGVRIGFHEGALVEREGDVFGDTVNLAARLTEMASRGQIITSLETVERLAAPLKMDCRRLYSAPVKGREKEVDICELMWTDTDDATQMTVQTPQRDDTKTGAFLRSALSEASLRLVHREITLQLKAARRSAVLGRDATADLVVADPKASRAHCEIELRQGKFVLADRSANGTYLTMDGDSEIVLRREETMLRGHGVIALGQSRATATELVEFFCE
ncbi:MAG TPA: adenylate/guanylate cyclase domain-containing protein [Usitatibacter sp.]|jgi:adenylate cyclase